METKTQKVPLAPSNLLELKSVVDVIAKRHLSREDAEDVSQNVFVSLLQWLKNTATVKLEGDDLKFYAIRVTKNALLKKQISNGKNPTISIDDAETHSQFEDYLELDALKALMLVEEIRRLTMIQRWAILFQKNTDLLQTLLNGVNQSEEKLAAKLGFEGVSAREFVTAVNEPPLNDEQIWEILKQFVKIGKVTVIKVERARAREQLQKRLNNGTF